MPSLNFFIIILKFFKKHNIQNAQNSGSDFLKNCANFLLTKCAGGGIMENSRQHVRWRGDQKRGTINSTS